MNWAFFVGGAIAAFSSIIGLMMFFDVPRKLQRGMDDTPETEESLRQ